MVVVVMSRILSISNSNEAPTLRPDGWERKAKAYLRKHQLVPRQLDGPPHAELGIVVVIPCYNEPDLRLTLDSLQACRSPRAAVEVLVVINAPEDAGTRVLQQNRRSLQTVQDVDRSLGDPRLRLHALYFSELPPELAGVGCARKAGMDEASRRFADLGRPEGLILSLDADCRVAPDYLQAVESHFACNPKSPAGSIYFEHPLDGDCAGIMSYELFLRYYVHALRFSGYPHAFQTVGSAMAVRANAYVKQGGMNRRRAGEDFYFLQKLMALGRFSEVRDTVISPSARRSTRVPFGTGQAIGQIELSGHAGYPAFSPRLFRDLAPLFGRVERACELGFQPLPRWAGLAPVLVDFLRGAGFDDKMLEIRRNAVSPRTLRQRFYNWFNPFRVLKFANFATASAYPKVDVIHAAHQLLQWRGIQAPENGLELLRAYRELDSE